MNDNHNDEKESVVCQEHHKNHNRTYSNGADVVYGLGIVGAAVYFVSHAVGFWAVVVALLKAFVWPAFFTYEIFQFLLK